MDEHLCLTDLIDQDLTANEYYQTLPDFIKDKLKDAEIRSFHELQKYVSQSEQQERTEYPEL